MIRLDKYLADMGIGTRSQVKQYLKKGMITVNGDSEKKPERKIDPEKDIVFYQGNQVSYVEYEYFMFHKPKGCVSATQDTTYKTVLDYIDGAVRKDLFPVGRLDLDTEGLLLITNDGPLCHKMLSPNYHVPKTYYAKVEGEIEEEAITVFLNGIDIGDEKKTLPAKLEIQSSGAVSEILLTIVEGRYHQIKRMCAAIGHPVLYLKRMTFGTLTLDENLKPGEYRSLTEKELKALNITDSI